jgi:signal transduction histidine kinase
MTAELAAERDRHAEDAVTAERVRISRELHDVVAHNISVLVVQAEAANTVFNDDPPAARAALSAIARTGRQTVDEMRRMLSMLRSRNDELALTPLPGLTQLPDLVAAMRAAASRCAWSSTATRSRYRQAST